jgi:integrase
VNRILTVLKAALNRAFNDGKIKSDHAWRRVEPIQNVDSARIRRSTKRPASSIAPMHRFENRRRRILRDHHSRPRRNRTCLSQSRPIALDAGSQSEPMDEANGRAKISPPINFHGLRHTWASHAVMNGMPLMVVARNMGHSDTRMVEKHYGHLAPSYISDAVRAHAPRFGITSNSSVQKFLRTEPKTH